MSDQIISFKADPPVTRWTYAKTALVLLIAAEVANVFYQTNLVEQKPEWKYSIIIIAVLMLLISYFLSRSPLTKSLTIDYARRLVIVGFATVTSADKTLEIPFARLGVDTDAPAAAADATAETAVNAKWRTKLLLDGKEVYLFLSSENGFTSAQLNEFNNRVRECQEAGKS